MSLVRIQFVAVTILLMLSGGFYTMSYFSDFEGAVANVFGASLLDQDVAGQPIDGLLCSQADRVDTVLYSGNLGTMPFAYGFKVENATGTLCGDLSARLLTEEAGMLYDGPLLSLTTDNIELPGGMTDELFLELRLSPGASAAGTCTFDTGWFASQFMGSVMPGYSDVELITHTVSGSGTGVGGGCIPPGDTVKLELTKAISGDDQGFELSDFSYRVTGNGIDAVVPHKGMIPLPVGEYTIEELVPEGFVKEDWRIGWYGQCERGDTFFTTITIDEGNVDHGVLYCQADNQYRPDQRRDQTEESSRESSRSSREREEHDDQMDDSEPEELKSTSTDDVGESVNDGHDGADGEDGTGEGSTGESVNNSEPGSSGDENLGELTVPSNAILIEETDEEEEETEPEPEEEEPEDVGEVKDIPVEESAV